MYLQKDRICSTENLNRTYVRGRLLAAIKSFLTSRQKTMFGKTKESRFWNAMDQGAQESLVREAFTPEIFATLVPRARTGPYKSNSQAEWNEYAAKKWEDLASKWQEFCLKVSYIQSLDLMGTTKEIIYKLVKGYWRHFPQTSYGTSLFGGAWQFLNWDRWLFNGINWSNEEKFMRKCDILSQFYLEITEKKEKTLFKQQVKKFWEKSHRTYIAELRDAESNKKSPYQSIAENFKRQFPDLIPDPG